MSKFNSPDFKALQKQWYKKLSKTGFRDIEHDEEHFNTYPHLKRRIPRNHETPVYQASKEEYYRLAGHFLYDHPFTSPTDRRIWELHADGSTLDEIVTDLKKAKIRTHRNAVHKVVKTLSNIMVKQCLPKK